MTELEQLIRLCVGLGAPAPQAAIMAAQLQKRADQLVGERGIARETAMQHLLEVFVKGRNGETSSGSAPPLSLRPPVADEEKLRALFQVNYGREPDLIARAPGRIEVIGNHTDYNGGIVLGVAIDRHVWVAWGKREDDRRSFCSAQTGEMATWSGGAPPEKITGAQAWLNYPLGILATLPEFGLRAPDGFDCAVTSDLPLGAGLSSSAAFELATALALIAATRQTAAKETIVELCWRAENRFVGVPCGIFDQAVSALGDTEHAVLVDGRGPRFSRVKLPADARFWIFNTGHKRALAESLYSARHAECAEAAQRLGVSQLAELGADQLPSVAGKLSPSLFSRVRHVVEEIARVTAAAGALERGDLTALGRLLTASHRSSQHLFENSTAELDFLVDALITRDDVYGARLTGGGFGGAVVALVAPGFGAQEAAAVATSYEAKFGARPETMQVRAADGAEIVAR